MKNFSYPQVVKFLDEALIFGIKPNLLRINKILELMGDPHKNGVTDFIHVVGTNGKTSTTIMTAYILNNHGFRTAYHISPHIKEYNERIWFCQNLISKDDFAQLFNDIYPYILKVNDLNLDGEITQFEIIAAMAFWFCYKEKIDVMVLEAGLGGRWDATNAADSKVVGLTGVSLEHTAVLGNTIKIIAEEKSKVIKNNAMVATTTTDQDVLNVLKEQVLKTNSTLFLYGKDFYLTNVEKNILSGWQLSLKTIYTNINNIYLPLIGNYQPKNFSLAVALSELYLKLRNKKIDKESVKKAVAKIKVTGRFEILREKPLVIADVSHNPEGLDNFFQNLNDIVKDLHKFEKKIIIFSVLKDKDYKKMLSMVINNADILILTSSNTSRSLTVLQLENELKKIIEVNKKSKIKNNLLDLEINNIPKNIYTVDNIRNSLDFALKIANSNDIICITGSITNLKKII